MLGAHLCVFNRRFHLPAETNRCATYWKLTKEIYARLLKSTNAE